LIISLLVFWLHKSHLADNQSNMISTRSVVRWIPPQSIVINQFLGCAYWFINWG